MESTLEFLKRKLKEAGPDKWPGIAAEAGVAKTLPRKLAYGDRPNPGIQTVQPLLDYFDFGRESADEASTQQPPGDASASAPVAGAQRSDTGERRRATDPESRATAAAGGPS